MKRRKSWRPWLDPVGLVARLLLAVIALSTAIEVLESTTSLREERLSAIGIQAVGELDLVLGLVMLWLAPWSWLGFGLEPQCWGCC